MSDTIVIAVITAMPATLAVIISALINRESFKGIAKTAEDTHQIVNSQRTEMMAVIDNLQQQVAALKAHIEKTSNG